MILCIKLLPYMQYRYTVILQEIICGGNISTNLQNNSDYKINKIIFITIKTNLRRG